VDMCKGKRKYDYEAPMMSSLLDCTWLEKEWKSRLSTTWHPSLHFTFLSLDSSLSYLSYHSSFLFLFFFFLSYTYFSLSLLFYFIFLSLFSILILFSLFSLSWHLFLSFQRSQLLSFLHAYNLKF
jgi:hypothetical protein